MTLIEPQVAYDKIASEALAAEVFGNISLELRKMLIKKGSVMKSPDGREFATSNPGWLDAALFFTDYLAYEPFAKSRDLREVAEKLESRLNMHISALLKATGSEKESEEYFEVATAQLRATTRMRDKLKIFLAFPA